MKILMVMGSVLVLAAQDNSHSRPLAQREAGFDVVSLKHTGNLFRGRQPRPLQFRGGRLTGDIPLVGLIQFAYPLHPWRFSGPDWVRTEFYEIGAIAPAETGVDSARAMLRSVLADRMGLKCHFEDRTASVYALVAGNGRPSLHPAKDGAFPQNGARSMGVFKSESATLADFAGFLSSLVLSEVYDETGLAGRFSFDLDWSGELGNSMRSGLPDLSVVYAGVKTLGLKLEPRKAALKFLLIDSISKEPTPN
jgi:uncharacterized protein (TIGR03435 family)